MKKLSRKLVLSRETLGPLQDNVLDDVRGGTLSLAVGVSIRACARASAAATRAVCPKAVEAAKWVASAASAGIVGNRADDVVATKCN